MIKLIRTFCLSVLVAVCGISAGAQNVNISLDLPNEGKVAKGGTIALKVVIANTNASLEVAAYKLRPVISVPPNVKIPVSGHILPDGWAILSNDGQNIRVSNGTGTIPPNVQREILIQLEGVEVGGPINIGANMSFANGNAPGNSPGSATSGNSTADDNSTVGVTVVDVLPVIISDFYASAKDCVTKLVWVTQAEYNSHHFDIQRYKNDGSGWDLAGTVNAAGFSGSPINYSFTDNLAEKVIGKKVVYRIKMVDKNGSFKYSRMASVNSGCNDFAISVYPNPVQHGLININVTGTSPSYDLRLLSVNGQLVSQQKLVSGSNSVKVKELANGIYEMQVTDATSSVKTLKVQVQH